MNEDYLVKIKSDNDEIESLSPQVFIMSSGEVTPFKVLFLENDSDSKRSSSLEISMSGIITEAKPDEE